MIHAFTTLPGHDPSKVRTPDCITASKSDALDVRVLRVAETLQGWAVCLYADVIGTSATAAAAIAMEREAETLREIAAEIRDAATPPRNEIAATRDAATITELRDVWTGTAATRPEMEPGERIRFLEAVVGRLLVIEAKP